MVRNQGLDESVVEEDREWVHNHRQKIEEFLESKKEREFSVELEGKLAELHQYENECFEKFNLFYDAFLKEDESVTCTLCGISFAEKKYAIQHINLMHYEKVVDDYKVMGSG